MLEIVTIFIVFLGLFSRLSPPIFSHFPGVSLFKHTGISPPHSVHRFLAPRSFVQRNETPLGNRAMGPL